MSMVFNTRHPDPTSQQSGNRAWLWWQWQWRAERVLRRWGVALAGFAVGAGGVGLMLPPVLDQQARVKQDLMQLQQQLAARPVPPVMPAVPQVPLFPSDFRHRLASLPGPLQLGQVWTDVHQALARQGLQWLLMRPLQNPVAHTSTNTNTNTNSPIPPVQVHPLPSQALLVRVLGRFEDWASAWEALADSGVWCSIDKISMVATATPGEVQIEAVLRVWMRPLDIAEPPQAATAWRAFAQFEQRLSTPLLSAVFAKPSFELASVSSALGGAPLAASGAGAGMAPEGELSKDPRQWPLAQVRLVGLWQQGANRQAILMAGSHWARVGLGQRVTQEGHRVAAITDAGVRLQVPQGAAFLLDWPVGYEAAKPGSNK